VFYAKGEGGDSMKEKRTSEFVASVVVNVIILGVVNTAPVWRHLTHNVVLASWTHVLWAMNTALGIVILGNLLLAYYRPARLQAFFGMVFDAANFFSSLVFYIVFPLDFSPIVGDWLNTLLRALLIVGMCASAIAFIVHLVRMIVGDAHRVSPAHERSDGGDRKSVV
jgi:hypothetical protein